MSDLAQFAHYTGVPAPTAHARLVANGGATGPLNRARIGALRIAPLAAEKAGPMTAKPALSFRQVWNMCVGFLGIQFAFALQNADVSRIFQTLGADLREIPILWVAAPLSGLIVQPIIGYASDHTWTRLGRRRPYFLGGALLTTLALAWMPNSSTLWVAAVMLWLMDAAINVSMEPFRAFVGDQLPESQRPLGFALQSFFIGVGAVLASILPWALARIGVANVAPAGQIPATVRIAFYVGAAVLFCAVLWTVVTTREYPPERLLGFARKESAPPASRTSPERGGPVSSCWWREDWGSPRSGGSRWRTSSTFWRAA